MSLFGSVEEQRINICFPTPLPPLELFTTLEETGFTTPEKVALRNGFKVLKRRAKEHAFKIYLNFYTENHFILERFRCGIGKFYLKELYEHTNWLIEHFIRLVEEGLDNVMQFNIISTNIAARHRAQRFSEGDVTLLAQNIRDYILDVLKNVSSPSLANAVTKLCQLLVIYHYGEDLNFLKEINNTDSFVESTNSRESFHSGYKSVRMKSRKKKLRSSVQAMRMQSQVSSSEGLQHFGKRGGYEIKGPFKELHPSYMKKKNK